MYKQPELSTQKNPSCER